MKGDFSRSSFDRSRHYHKVLQQQGRVHMDADWNEQQDIDAYLRDALGHDAIGAPGVPMPSPGFAIGLDGQAKDLTISAGHLYVDGVLCENDAPVTLSTQPDFPAAATGLPGYAPPPASGRYLAYLDVWERHVSALLDPSIRETALGGTDTATRTKLVWQVRLESVGAGQTSDDFDTGWFPPEALSSGTMIAQTDPPGAAGPCVLPPLAGYRSLTNQLYRVEIHTGGWLGWNRPAGYPTTTPTFKWSRDNGTVVAVVAGITSQSITITQVGPDVAASFQPGQWVELIDTRSELAQQHGQLYLIASVAPQTGTIVIDNATPLAAGSVDLTEVVLLRRWDQIGTVAVANGVPLQTGPTSLEAGISVKFTEGGYRAGDYWTFPARTAIDAETGSIVWPGGNAPLPPMGITHHYAPLALVDYAADHTYNLVEDCRTVFDPLTGRLPPFRVRWQNGTAQGPLVPGQDLALSALQAGISVGCSTPLDGASISSASVQLVADVPVTLGRLAGTNDTTVVGTQPINLACDLVMTGTKRFTVTPSTGASALLTSLLTPQAAAPRVNDLFTVNDFYNPSTWAFTPEGWLTASASHYAALRTVVVSRQAPVAPIAHAGTTFNPGTTTDNIRVGLVFNYRSNSDFWVLYYQNRVTTGAGGGITYSYTEPFFGVARYYNGAWDGIGHSMSAGPFNFAATSVQFDITQGQSSLNFGVSIKWNQASDPENRQLDFSHATYSGGPPIPLYFDYATGFGLYEESNSTAVFQRLEWTHGNDKPIVVLPAGGPSGGGAARILVRLVARSTIQSAAQAAQSTASQAPLARTPGPDFQTHAWVVPAIASGGGKGIAPPTSGGIISSGGGIISSGGGIISSGGGGITSSGGGSKGSYVSGGRTLGANLL